MYELMYLQAVVLLSCAIFVSGGNYLDINPNPDCPYGWAKNAKLDKCYLFVEKQLSFSDASKFCKARASKLPSIHSWEENVFIQHLIMRYGRGESWIGLTDRYSKEREEFKWEDGTKVNFLNFASGHPVRCWLWKCKKIRTCAAMKAGDNTEVGWYGMWKDYDCGGYVQQRKSFICVTDTYNPTTTKIEASTANGTGDTTTRAATLQAGYMKGGGTRHPEDGTTPPPGKQGWVHKVKGFFQKVWNWVKSGGTREHPRSLRRMKRDAYFTPSWKLRRADSNNTTVDLNATTLLIFSTPGFHLTEGTTERETTAKSTVAPTSKKSTTKQPTATFKPKTTAKPTTILMETPKFLLTEAPTEPTTKLKTTKTTFKTTGKGTATATMNSTTQTPSTLIVATPKEGLTEPTTEGTTKATAAATSAKTGTAGTAKTSTTKPPTTTSEKILQTPTMELKEAETKAETKTTQKPKRHHNQYQEQGWDRKGNKAVSDEDGQRISALIGNAEYGNQAGIGSDVNHFFNKRGEDSTKVTTRSANFTAANMTTVANITTPAPDSAIAIANVSTNNTTLSASDKNSTMGNFTTSSANNSSAEELVTPGGNYTISATTVASPDIKKDKKAHQAAKDQTYIVNGVEVKNELSKIDQKLKELKESIQDEDGENKDEES